MNYGKNYSNNISSEETMNDDTLEKLKLFNEYKSKINYILEQDIKETIEKNKLNNKDIKANINDVEGNNDISDNNNNEKILLNKLKQHRIIKDHQLNLLEKNYNIRIENSYILDKMHELTQISNAMDDKIHEISEISLKEQYKASEDEYLEETSKVINDKLLEINNWNNSLIDDEEYRKYKKNEFLSKKRDYFGDNQE